MIHSRLSALGQKTGKAALRVVSMSNVVGSVYLNDRYRGKTGSEIKLRPGNYNLVVGRAGYQSYSTRVTLLAGQKKIKYVTLGKATQAAAANAGFDESSMMREYHALKYNPSKNRYQAFLSKYQNEPRAKNQVAAIRNRLRVLERPSGRGISQNQYNAIVKASEDTISCNFLTFGCEDPLELPPYDPEFSLKHYRRVKVYANRPPPSWIASEISLRQGDQVLVLASGQIATCPTHCNPRSINKSPSDKLVLRIGENRKFFKFYGRGAGEGVWNDFRAQRNGELQFIVRDWRTYPPPANWYDDNTGSFLLDVFVYDRENKEGFKRLLRAMIRQNPEDEVFAAQARGVLK